MARLRLLLALLLIGVGTTLGALAISGYYEPHMRHGQAATAPVIPAQPVDKPRLSLWLPKHGFAADVAKSAAKPQARPKAAIKSDAGKPRAPAQAVSATKEKRPQAAAAPW